jgi:hypothetical protein
MAIADGSQDFYEGGPSTFGPDLGTRETFCFVIDRLGLFASAVALPGCDYVLCNATFRSVREERAKYWPLTCLDYGQEARLEERRGSDRSRLGCHPV